MRTPATIKNHPLHPLLVTFPIGLWVFSLAADIIRFAHWGPPDVWRDVAFFSMAAGLAGALLAAVPGLIDLLSLTDPKLRRTGLIHMFIMLAVVVLYAINWGLRFTHAGDGTAPMVLSIIGVLFLLVGGWLGADLVHEHRVSVEEPGERPVS